MGEKSLGFNLFVDKETFMMMLAMSLMYKEVLEEEDTKTLVDKKIIRRELDNFMTKIDKYAHKVGWCSDPDCMWDGEGEKPDMEYEDEDE